MDVGRDSVILLACRIGVGSDVRSAVVVLFMREPNRNLIRDLRSKTSVAGCYQSPFCFFPSAAQFAIYSLDSLAPFRCSNS